MPQQRMSAERRRALVLAAATTAFARDGFAGTSTDAVAREAGVSQPYVVRIFGTKRDLFVEAFDVATAQVRDAFATALDEIEIDLTDENPLHPLGEVYTELVLQRRDVLRMMVHGFAAASDPVIGQFARRRMGELFDLVRTTGCTDEQARDFVAYGMLLNVMLSMGALEHPDETPAMATLTACAFGEIPAEAGGVSASA